MYTPNISHLMFADDMFLFGQATIRKGESLKQALEKYSKHTAVAG